MKPLLWFENREFFLDFATMDFRWIKGFFEKSSHPFIITILVPVWQQKSLSSFLVMKNKGKIPYLCVYEGEPTRRNQVMLGYWKLYDCVVKKYKPSRRPYHFEIYFKKCVFIREPMECFL